jgi:hypothetical protein
MSSSSGLTRWRSEPTTSVARSCDVDVSVADDVDGDAGGELLQVYPPYQGLAVEPLPERARSLTDVNIRESTSSPVTSSSQIRSTLSDDRLYADGPSSQARNRTRRDDAEIMEHSTDGSSSFTRVDVDSNGDVRDAKTRSIGGDSFDSLDFVNVGDEMTADSRTVERSRRSNDVATDDDDAIGSFVSIDGASVDYSDDDSLARALAAGRRVPNRAGLDKALRAKERASRGGMAYYVDLEPHFDRLPNQQERHSLDSQTADSVGIHKPTTAASDTSNR